MLRSLLASTFCLLIFSEPTLADDKAVALEAAKSSKQCWPLDKSVLDDELHRLFIRCNDAFEKYHQLSTHASSASLRKVGSVQSVLISSTLALYAIEKVDRSLKANDRSSALNYSGVACVSLAMATTRIYATPTKEQTASQSRKEKALADFDSFIRKTLGKSCHQLNNGKDDEPRALNADARGGQADQKSEPLDVVIKCFENVTNEINAFAEKGPLSPEVKDSFRARIEACDK